LIRKIPTRSCGCAKSDTFPVSMIGDRFGCLVVVKEEELLYPNSGKTTPNSFMSTSILNLAHAHLKNTP